jgi:ADP-ribosyl-[dinitrogen reductase] hydrolase
LDAVDEEGTHRYDLKTLSRKNVKNKFKVKPGQWTDDSSMGLCLADTLLTRGRYDGSDVRVRYHNWWFRGYNNAFGNDSRIGSVGLGGNVAQSLRAMAAHQKPSDCYEAQTQDAGNGTIMRLSPVPVFFYRNPIEAAKVSAESSFATHPGPIAAAACAFQGFLMASAIGRTPEAPKDAATFLESVVKAFVDASMPGAGNCNELARLLASAEPSGGKEECWNWKAPKLRIQSTLRARGHRYNGYPCTPDYFGSYCIDGLAVALWSFYHTRSYAEAVVRCTNFLGDADTTSAICGQIAGAFYGYESILPDWRKDLQKWDDLDIACRGALLWALQESFHANAATEATSWVPPPPQS